jgi:precorrin-8X/cobalt-precorrin-8 methylmutase
VAVGNAPTALFEVLRLAAEQGIRPALVVGAPVGFVNAAESKAALAESELPHITVRGRKGGSPVAAAIVNALMRLVPGVADA